MTGPLCIQILPAEFSRDTDRVSRFQREAEPLAALNHRNIAGIYDLQQSDAATQIAPRQAKVVELRYFGGLTEEEIVAALKISPRTVRRDWHLVRAWLLRELKR